MSTPHPQAEDLELVERLVAECLERQGAEGPSAVEEVCRKHPDHVDRVRRRLARLASMGMGMEKTPGAASPGAMPDQVGPYRLLRHPNYWIVAGEILILPLAFGAWEIAVGFSLANALLLAHRVRLENAALGPRRVAS